VSRREDKTWRTIGAFVVARANDRFAHSDYVVMEGRMTTLTKDETWRIIGVFVIVSVLLSALIMTL
jgi:hypothetical protein